MTRIVYDHYRSSGRDYELIDRQKRKLLSEEQFYPSNEDTVIRGWERDVVRQVLSKLSKRDRQALMLKQKGYSHTEIAEALQVDPQIVGTLLMRATKRFKQNMTAEEVMDS